MASVEALREAVREALRSGKPRKFTQSVELVINLRDIDLKKPENRFTEVIELPHGLGSKARKVAVVASGALAVEARKSPNVDRVFERDEIEVLTGNKKAAKKLARQFDYFLVDTSLISLVARALGAALGYIGKAPVPVPAGADINALAARYKRSVTVRVRKNPQANCIIGTEEMGLDQLVENAMAVLNRVVEKLPKRWANVKSAYIKRTMGEPIELRIRESE
ncbi:MAG: 50S ribosomal protein L1 [Nitrososphaerota archaeon]|nr:50S ribosomal protein L1 [Candidatus Calditenuis fumarioli]